MFVPFIILPHTHTQNARMMEWCFTKVKVMFISRQRTRWGAKPIHITDSYKVIRRLPSLGIMNDLSVACGWFVMFVHAVILKIYSICNPSGLERNMRLIQVTKRETEQTVLFFLLSYLDNFLMINFLQSYLDSFLMINFDFCIFIVRYCFKKSTKFINKILN